MRDFIFMITRTRDFVCARVIKSVRVIKIIQNESLGEGQKGLMMPFKGPHKALQRAL